MRFSFRIGEPVFRRKNNLRKRLTCEQQRGIFRGKKELYPCVCIDDFRIYDPTEGHFPAGFLRRVDFA